MRAVVRKTVGETLLGKVDVQEVASRTPDTVGEVRGGALEHLYHLGGLMGSLDEGKRGDIGTGITSPALQRNVLGEGQVWVGRECEWRLCGGRGLCDQQHGVEMG